ncbi:hypothetical protein G6F56_007781 [Rhizopus delemar]|nr:hypothetical protein G6F56_007781 [Rhizopus delemar]
MDIDEEEVVYNVNVPLNEFSKIEQYSLRLQKIFTMASISVENQKDIRGLFNEVLSEAESLPPNSKLSSDDQLKTRLQKLSPDLVYKHEMCDDGCYLFDSKTDGDMIQCPICKKPRNGKIVKMACIGQKPANLLSNADMRQMLKERKNDREEPRTEEGEKVYGGYFDGEVYSELKKTYFQGEYDIGVSLHIDGYQSKNSTETMCIINCIIMNFDPSIRYTDECMFQIATLYGNTNSDLDSFLKPIVARACVIPLVVSDDIPGASKILHHQGHGSFYGCGFCYACGEHGPSGQGMYFEQRNCQIRPKDCLLSTDDQLRLPHPEPRLNRDNITKANDFKNTVSFTGIEFFGLDEMHLIGNMAKQIHRMLTPIDRKKYMPKHLNENDYPLLLGHQAFTLIEQDMNDFRRRIPLAFSGCFKGITEKPTKSYRSVDWINFLAYVIPLLVHVPNQKAVLAFVRACTLALQWNITESEIDESHSNLEAWYSFIDGCIQDNQLVNTAYTCNMHTMSHIPRMVKKMGPLRAYSCRPMERMIGKMKRLTNARMATGINSGNILERLALFQYLEDTGIVPLKSSQQKPAYKDDHSPITHLVKRRLLSFGIF